MFGVHLPQIASLDQSKEHPSPDLNWPSAALVRVRVRVRVVGKKGLFALAFRVPPAQPSPAQDCLEYRCHHSLPGPSRAPSRPGTPQHPREDHRTTVSRAHWQAQPDTGSDTNAQMTRPSKKQSCKENTNEVCPAGPQRGPYSFSRGASEEIFTTRLLTTTETHGVQILTSLDLPRVKGGTLY